MNIIIRDMELPESCFDCRFYHEFCHVDLDYCDVLQRTLRTDQVIYATACPLEEYMEAE